MELVKRQMPVASHESEGPRHCETCRRRASVMPWNLHSLTRHDVAVSENLILQMQSLSSGPLHSFLFSVFSTQLRGQSSSEPRSGRPSEGHIWRCRSIEETMSAFVHLDCRQREAMFTNDSVQRHAVSVGPEQPAVPSDSTTQLRAQGESLEMSGMLGLEDDVGWGAADEVAEAETEAEGCAAHFFSERASAALMSEAGQPTMQGVTAPRYASVQTQAMSSCPLQP